MKVDKIFEDCLKLALSKRADYTASTDNHENFRRSSEVVSWFSNNRDKPYIALIATKIARLSSLLSNNRAPNHESVEDTFKDLVNYCALWAERVTESDITNTSTNLPVNPNIVANNPVDAQKIYSCYFCKGEINKSDKLIQYSSRAKIQAHIICYSDAFPDDRKFFNNL